MVQNVVSEDQKRTDNEGEKNTHLPIIISGVDQSFV